jgi:DNA (cytosine-5)-methyltransferase 1
MNHGSLFSGIGGFDLAAEWSGFTNLFNCEWEEFPRRVLKHHFPNAKQFGDIKEFDATAYSGRIDILSGGFPCQPFSVAGKRKGSEDERHLWPEMLRVIGECQPRWVVGENVRGLVSWSDGLVLEACYSDLENLGYSVQSFIIPACATNAPHRRDRVWIVAHSDNIRTSSRLGEVQSKDGEIPERNNDAKPSDTSTRNASDTQRIRLEHSENNGEMGGRPKKTQGEGGKFTHDPKTRREVSNWEAFPTVSPVRGGDDGLPKELDGITFSKWRRESIKGYGNAIVPQVAHRIFESIKEYEHESMLK